MNHNYFQIHSAARPSLKCSHETLRPIKSGIGTGWCMHLFMRVTNYDSKANHYIIAKNCNVWSVKKNLVGSGRMLDKPCLITIACIYLYLLLILYVVFLPSSHSNSSFSISSNLCCEKRYRISIDYPASFKMQERCFPNSQGAAQHSCYCSRIFLSIIIVINHDHCKLSTISKQPWPSTTSINHSNQLSLPVIITISLPHERPLTTINHHLTISNYH